MTPTQKQQIIAAAAIGCDRETAAAYAGIDVETITAAASVDEAFARDLRRAERKDHVWTWDFVFDRTTGGIAAVPDDGVLARDAILGGIERAHETARNIVHADRRRAGLRQPEGDRGGRIERIGCVGHRQTRRQRLPAHARGR